MTFSKSRFDKKYNWELVRFSSKLNTTIVGGASKLFKYFRKTYKGAIVSFANRRYSSGNLYKTLGFKLDSTTKPGYFYYNLNNGKVKSRISCQKHKLTNLLYYDDKKSEYEIMMLNGYDRIWDAGNLKYIIK